MHFSSVLKVLTGVMAFGGVNAAVTGPDARSRDVAIDARIDKSQVVKCAACAFFASKAIEEITGFGEDGSGLTDLLKDVGRSFAGKKICEQSFLSAIGGPFCENDNDIKKGGDDIDGQDPQTAADQVKKSDPDFGSSITEKIKGLGLAAISTKLLGSII
ncbi:hypothetical protein F5X99DRAFT_391563 [Biscogniauxia marginata]|nr:hypothetical protein F5X99DRAFT_391563 [Biscogniauxia marginata]